MGVTQTAWERMGSTLLYGTAMYYVWEVTDGKRQYWPGGGKEEKEEEVPKLSEEGNWQWR